MRRDQICNLSTDASPTKQQVKSLHYCSWSQHTAEINRTPPRSAEKAPLKQKNRGGSEEMCICLWVPACFGWLCFFASFQTCVWHLHARMTEPPAVMNIPRVTCYVLKTFHQLLRSVQPTETVSDISMAKCVIKNKALMSFIVRLKERKTRRGNFCVLKPSVSFRSELQTKSEQLKSKMFVMCDASFTMNKSCRWSQNS